MSSQRSESRYQLPETAPGIIKGEEVRHSDGSLWALYCLDSGATQAGLQELASELEKEYIIEVPVGKDIPLIGLAPAPALYQASLESALKTHIQYGNANKDNQSISLMGFRRS